MNRIVSQLFIHKIRQLKIQYNYIVPSKFHKKIAINDYAYYINIDPNFELKRTTKFPYNGILKPAIKTTFTLN
jgi:hypothetical protein